ncbi:CPBP family intramembrane metalloprotease [Apilactobacillus apisilvae]|uniref:CPBP family intramembrane metalloprotease n=1 Tax=Apilactobacillus apisilvae TaxID=2923364 RepID=A0ABY4PHF8_9LACO|nr:CPBP family intramembrane glutamic endopeptidase [Apilactobacillus apisilvae]UQS84909.1 CPBP family intramembrane metalloprotease [Apilactobacillus apisilvae]
MLVKKISSKWQWTMIPLLLILETLLDGLILPLIYAGGYRLLTHASLVENHYMLYLNIYKILSIFVILILNYLLFRQTFYLKPSKEEAGWKIFIFCCLLIILITCTSKHYWTALDVGIIAAIPEELMFRGVIMGWVLEKITKFKQTYVNVSIALTVAAIIFGCFHYINLAQQSFGFTTLQVLNAIGVGMILGAIYIKSGSLLIPMATHFIYDFVVTLAKGMPESNYTAVGGKEIIFEFIILAIYAAIAISLVCFHFENNLLLQKIENKSQKVD